MKRTYDRYKFRFYLKVNRNMFVEVKNQINDCTIIITKETIDIVTKETIKKTCIDIFPIIEVDQDVFELIKHCIIPLSPKEK